VPPPPVGSHSSGRAPTCRGSVSAPRGGGRGSAAAAAARAPIVTQRYCEGVGWRRAGGWGETAPPLCGDG